MNLDNYLFNIREDILDEGYKEFSEMSERGRHKRVDREKGSAKKSKCVSCGNKITSPETNQWAAIGVPKSTKDYKCLCKSCHSKEDKKWMNLIKHKKDMMKKYGKDNKQPDNFSHVMGKNRGGTKSKYA